MKLTTPTRRTVVLGAAVAVGLSGSAVALAVPSSSPAVYAACLGAQSKMLYNVVVNPRSGQPSCRSGDKVISWNEEGPQGPRGPRGPAGEDGAPGGGAPLLGAHIVDEGPVVPSAGSMTAQSAYCSDGEMVTGGGGYIEELGAGAITGSRPVFDGVTGRYGWQAAMKNDSIAEVHFWVYAICAPAGAALP